MADFDFRVDVKAFSQHYCPADELFLDGKILAAPIRNAAAGAEESSRRQTKLEDFLYSSSYGFGDDINKAVPPPPPTPQSSLPVNINSGDVHNADDSPSIRRSRSLDDGTRPPPLGLPQRRSSSTASADRRHDKVTRIQCGAPVLLPIMALTTAKRSSWTPQFRLLSVSACGWSSRRA